MGWLITGGIVFLLAVLPLGVLVNYDQDGAVVKVILGPVKITLFPRPKKEEKTRKKTEKSDPGQEKQKEEQNLPKPPQPPRPEKKQPAPEEKRGGSLLDFLPLVKLALELLGDFRRKLRLNELYLRLIMAGGDPCDLAVNYGRAWAAVGNLMPQLERFFVIKKRDIEVECDFTATKTLVIARLDITITLGRLLALIVIYGIRALIQFLKIKKGGAEK